LIVLPAILMTLLLLSAVFLILLVLVQRGRGGGLAGAFGGLGGQSAFGTKAGDLFTRVTIALATFWILLCLFSVWILSGTSGRIETDAPRSVPAKSADGATPALPDRQPADSTGAAPADVPAAGDGTPADN
jgi:preprotein translocase subunit SecG